MPTASHRRHLVFSDLSFSGFAFSGGVTINVVSVFSVFQDFSVFRVFRICIQERCHNKCLADGWAGGRAGPDSPDEMLSISVSKAGNTLVIFERNHKVENTK